MVDVLPPVGELRAAAATAVATTPASARAVGRRRVGGARLEPAIEPIDVSVAAVGLRRRRHGNDDIVANLRDEGRGLRREAIHKLHEHLGRPGLARMEPAHQVVVGLGRGDQLVDLCVGESARVGELGEVVAIVLEILDVVLRGDPNDDELAPFVGLADRLDFDARRRLGQRAIVLQNVSVVGELGRRADVVAEDVLWRGDAGDERQMVDEWAAVVRACGPLGVELGEFGVLLLMRIAGFGDGLLGGKARNGGEAEGRREGQGAERWSAGKHSGARHELSRTSGRSRKEYGAERRAVRRAKGGGALCWRRSPAATSLWWRVTVSIRQWHCARTSLHSVWTTE